MHTVTVPPQIVSWLRRAIELSRRCRPVGTAFSVGAIITDPSGARELTSGFSREGSESEHAEETAIRKAIEAGIELRGAALFSSLEPCSVRLSGKRSCTDRIIAAGIGRVVYAMREPATFVRCEGHRLLEEAGIEVIEVSDLAAQVREVNRHLEEP